MDVLRILFYFTLLIGPLVLFHELGHFLAARLFGVKCIEFSIGFGPQILSWKPRETTFSFRLLPLGGYVRMLDSHEEDTGRTPEDEGRAITDKALWKRAIILAAGPVVSLLLPIPVFFVFLMLAPGVLPPVVGIVEPDLPAATAGLEPGDRIVSIGGKRMNTFEDLQREFAKSAEKPLTLTVQRHDRVEEIELTPQASKRRNPMLPMRIQAKGLVGIHLTQYGPVIDVRDPASPAAQAGFQRFDTLVEIDGVHIDLWSDIPALLEAEGEHQVTVLRDAKTHDAWGDVRMRHPVKLTLPSGDPHALGLITAQQTVWSILPGSPAELAGLQVGDRLLRVDDIAQADMSWARSRLSVEPDKDHTLVVERDGEEVELIIHPETRRVIAEFRSEREEVFIGFLPYNAMKYPPLDELTGMRKFKHAVTTSVRNTVSVASSLVVGVGMLITGEVDSNSVGGPLMIADVASQAAREGLQRFLGMMALISVNLGVLNLLPIPGLDGGQLAVIGLEAINRGPLSARTRQMIQYIGLAFLILLMLFVFKNDIERYWRSVANWLNT